MISIGLTFVVLNALVLTDKVNSDQTNRAIDIGWEAKHPPFDPNVYEEILDSELCAKQIEYLTLNDTLLMVTFLEAGPRIPRGILQGNLQDLGNYHQCLGINREVDDMVIEGKYCQISIGLSDFENFGRTTELENLITAIDATKDKINLYESFRKNVDVLDRRESKKKIRTDANNIGDLRFSVAICMPKPCSIRSSVSNLFGTELIDSEEQFCRFRNDKPWAPGVYVAIVFFSLIGVLAIFGTSYDIWNTLIQKRVASSLLYCLTPWHQALRLTVLLVHSIAIALGTAHVFFFYCAYNSEQDPKSLNRTCLSFSIYANASRLITFNPVRGAIECVDGIRAISMVWVAIGHFFGAFPPIINIADYYQWATSASSIWMTTAQTGVDTFFMLSGLMIVYTTIGKVSSMKLLKNLHLFYLNRFLRMFPLLATAVLLQVGVLHYIYDGAAWNIVATATRDCRMNWWITMFYVQNFFRPMCLSHTWYLAIDMQLHILSPLVLVWVLSGKKNIAWSGLIVALLVALTASSIYNFVNNFVGSTIRPVLRPGESDRYSRYYYDSTLTRCSPFFVGMCFGYLIHFWREENIRLTKVMNSVLWVANLTVLFLAFYATTPMKNVEYDNQTFDNLANSFMRPAWALGVGWLVLACAEGYGGPINWFLSLRMWKLPSRLSYAIYLLHVPIQFVIVGAASQQTYFSVLNFIYKFCGSFVIYFIASFVFTILVESPFSNIVKMLLGSGIKKSDPEHRGNEKPSENQLVSSQQQNESINEHNKNAI